MSKFKRKDRPVVETKSAPKSKPEVPFRITAKSWKPGTSWDLSGAPDAVNEDWGSVMQ